MRTGRLSNEEMRTSSTRNVIARALGMADQTEVNVDSYGAWSPVTSQ